MTLDAIISPLAAAIAALLFGALWYHPRLFGASWMRYSNFTPEMVEHARRNTHLFNALAFASAFVIAVGLREALPYGDLAGLPALFLGALLWAGFALPVSLLSMIWDQKPVALCLMNLGYSLGAFLLIAFIVSL
ncbi:MAG: DUF1761 domain-containing protein [Candidatus Kaiserbacteria bacterium]|nr:DUF1761 domain-containing protein [Candidatus Kaiserbacteria bacterium]